MGRAIGRAIEDSFLSRIPGYDSLRNIARQASDLEQQEGYLVTLPSGVGILISVPKAASSGVMGTSQTILSPSNLNNGWGCRSIVKYKSPCCWL